MDFLTILSYVLAVVETGALIGALIYVTRALQEKKIQRTRKGKKGGKSEELVQKTVRVYLRNAGISQRPVLIGHVMQRNGFWPIPASLYAIKRGDKCLLFFVLADQRLCRKVLAKRCILRVFVLS